MATTIYQIASEYADEHIMSLDDEQQVCFDACTHGANAVLEEIDDFIFNEIQMKGVKNPNFIISKLNKKIKELKGE